VILFPLHSDKSFFKPKYFDVFKLKNPLKKGTLYPKKKRKKTLFLEPITQVINVQ